MLRFAVSPTAASSSAGFTRNTLKLTCWEQALAILDAEKLKILEDFSAGDSTIFEAEINRVRQIGDSCTNKLSKGPKGTHVMTRGRVYGILQKMEEFAKIGDIVVKQCPEVVSLVWTGVRLCLQVCGILFSAD